MLVSRIAAVPALAALAAGALVLSLSEASAQGACESLWHQRNAIYAQAGHCFRTARARAVFGPGCFPPYGELGRADKRRVAAILAEEDALGCPR